MADSRLVFFEGIPGSGKTTIAGRFQACLARRGIAADFYPEGCEHPVDLPFHAYLSHADYRDVLSRYQRHAGWLRQKAILEDGYLLVPYKTPSAGPMDEGLFQFLQSREVCYANKPVVPFEMFCEIFRKRFERFAERASHCSTVVIFDGVLFQHQIHDIHRLYPEVGDDELIDYLCGLSQPVLCLEPMLFFLSQDSVRDSLVRTAAVRSQPKWATEETIAYYERRKGVELMTMQRLPMISHVICNPDYDWDRMFKTVIERFMPGLHY